MKEFLIKFGGVFGKGLDNFSTALMTFTTITIFVMVNVTVFCRYVLKISLGGWEEFPVLIMALNAWNIAPVVTKDDRHINIDLFTSMFKQRWCQCAFRILSNGIAAVCMTYFTSLAYTYVQQTYAFGEVTGGIGIPIWVFHAFICYGTTMVAFYSYVNVIKNILEIVKIAKERRGH